MGLSKKAIRRGLSLCQSSGTLRGKIDGATSFIYGTPEPHCMRGGRSRQYQGAYFRLLCAVFTYLLCPHPVKSFEMNLFSALANRLPEYTYSIPGLALYFTDPTHTALGYKLREKTSFKQADLQVDMTGKSVLVAGGNAGIGRSAAESLAGLGATVHIMCRNREKGQKAVDDIKASTGNPNVHLHIVDLSSLEQIKSFTSSFPQTHPRLDVLINNVAVMLGTRVVTSEGLDGALATNLLGFYRLTTGLTPLLKASAPSRVVNVVSAGMFTRKFSLECLQQERNSEPPPAPYDGAAAYALHHRCRVMLTQYWAKQLKDSGVVVNCVHPGWVDTPGLQTAPPMQGFYKAMQKSLRTEAMGADTVVWLSAAERAGKETGQYWFDRAARRTSLFMANTEPSEQDYKDLVGLCRDATGGQEE